MNISNHFTKHLITGLLFVMLSSIFRLVMATSSEFKSKCTADINQYGHPSACSCPKENSYNSQNGECDGIPSNRKMSTQLRHPLPAYFKILNGCSLNKNESKIETQLKNDMLKKESCQPKDLDKNSNQKK